MLKLQVNKLLEKEMDRKDFLKNTGIALVVLTGVAGIVKKLNLLGDGKQAAQIDNANVYGGAAYGNSPAKQPRA